MKDKTLENLLELDGISFVIAEDLGFWVKFEAKTIEKSAERPQGIRYSLTLHDKHNKRVLGFDNAHGVKGLRNSKHMPAYDHWHRDESDEGRPYTYLDAVTLIKDFWREVDKKIESLTKRSK